MNYRTILVDATRDAAHEARLRAARALATRFEAALVGMHVLPPPIVPASYGDALIYAADELFEAQREASREVHAKARTAFEQICGSGADRTFESADGDPGRLLARSARAADLVLISHAEVPALGVQGTVEQVVSGAGVPVLMLPQAAPETVGQVVISGWNGSREATRALHAALPFLAAAERVLLCAIGSAPEPGLEDAAAMLRRHGVVVQARQIDRPDGAAGEVLLHEAGALGADLLVMGAYGHARLREMVFGGATRHVLREARLPVLFSS